MFWKWIFVITVTIIASVGFFARHTLMSAYFQWYLEGYCHDCLGSALSYDALHHENGKWVIAHPVLTTRKRLEEGGYCCRAEQASVSMEILWRRASIQLIIDVDNPKIDVGRGAKEIKKILGRPSQRYRFFQVQTCFKVPQGTMLIHDSRGNDGDLTPLLFSVDLDCKEDIKGCASLWLGQHSENRRDFAAVFSQRKNGDSELAFNFADVDGVRLQEVLGGLWSEWAPLSITQGKLSGNLLLIFGEAGGPYAEGDVSIHHLEVFQPETACAIHIPAVTLHMESKQEETGGSKMQTVGKLDFPALFITGEPLPVMSDTAFSQATALKGSMSFQTGDYVRFALEGMVIFGKEGMTLKGVGDVHGDFENHKLRVQYDVNDLVLENEHFRLEIPSVTYNTLRKKRQEKSGIFVYDFVTHECYNSFAIRNASYLEKNSGLLFTDASAEMSIENNIAHFLHLSAYSNGLCFEGAIDIDWTPQEEGVFIVDVKARQMCGTVSQLQDFLSNLNNNLSLVKFPLEGNVSLREEGGRMRFSFYQGGYDFENTVRGSIVDGIVSSPNVDLSLQDLCLNFDYDCHANTLDFSNIQGTLLVGKPDHAEEYSLHATQAHFSNLAQNAAEFDIWVADQSQPVFRVAGKTSQADGVIVFDFDRGKSHFGSIYPSTFALEMRDWSQVDKFQLEFQFLLPRLISDLSTFSHTGLFVLSRTMLKELHDIATAEGECDALLEYSSDSGDLNFIVSGGNLTVGNNAFKRFLLTGKKKDNRWSVDQFLLDDISFAFDVIKEGVAWKIDFLGIRFGDSILIGMQGQFLEDDAHLDAHINLLEVDLGDFKESLQHSNHSLSTASSHSLSRWRLWPSALPLSMLAGKLHATGNVHADFDKTLPWGMRLDMKLKGSLSGAVFHGDKPQMIQGGIHVALDGTENVVRLFLNDGVYHVREKNHDLRNFVLEYRPANVTINADYRFQNKYLKINAGAQGSDFDHGDLIIAEAGVPFQQPLSINWVKDPYAGYVITRAAGAFSGLTFDLDRNPALPHAEDAFMLIGRISIDIHRALPLMNKEIAADIQEWGIGRHYTLSGRWTIAKDFLGSIGDNIAFHGEAAGQECEWLGYRFAQLNAEMTYHPTSTAIRNLIIRDGCGTLTVPQADFTYANGHWFASVPRLVMTDFRPCRMREMNPTPSRISKSLVVRQMEFQDLQGMLGDKTTFTGYGQMNFINPPKRNFQQTIFAIPAEILSRIGLDLAVLTPVRGTIHYELRDGRVYITRFRDMYSKGKLSKFFITNSGAGSYVDLDGNLNLQVRMRQNNLVFKLAELFTVTVNGTLKKPLYSLQKYQMQKHP